MPEFQNPNLQTQGPGGGGGSGSSFTSTITFITLMLLVFLGYQYFFHPNPPASQPSSAASAPQSLASSQPAAQSPAGSSSSQTAAATPVIAASQETTTIVENEQYRIVFSNRGALVRHWYLKNYYDSGGQKGGHNLDLVQPQASDHFGYPLSFFTYEPALTSQLNQALYQVSVAGAQSSPSSLILAPTTLTFHYSANGLDVVKTFHFDSTYVIGVDTRVTRNGVPVRALVQWPAGLGDMEEFLPSSTTRSPVRTSVVSQFAWSLNGKNDSTNANKVSGDATFDLPYSYAAVSDLYFAAAFLPDAPDRTTVVTLHHTIDLPSDLTDPNSKTRPADVIGLAMGDLSGDTHLRLFAGPKDTDVLNAIRATGPDGKPTGPSLESLIRFGWLTVIAKPLYLALRFLRGLLGPGAYNWGWAIIIVTVIINLLMLPTRIMMMRSSLKMMRIQPKVDALKRKYAHLKATDPKRTEMNTEMMELYKTEGVNMYGGCLPMLIQMPLLYAIYRVLANAVELRQAHWFWLTDLSSPDPLHILPILIIISMFLVQFITPSPGMDANQRRMMAIFMPIVFGFSMLHFASGLALYWGTGNVINLAIQVAVNQSSIGKEMHAIAARRAAKKSGAKVIQARR